MVQLAVWACPVRNFALPLRAHEDNLKKVSKKFRNCRRKVSTNADVRCQELSTIKISLDRRARCLLQLTNGYMYIFANPRMRIHESH